MRESEFARIRRTKMTCKGVLVTLAMLCGTETFNISSSFAQVHDHASASAATQKSIPPSSDAAAFHIRNPRYRVQPGDSLDLLFELTPDFNQLVAVQPDGYITLKAVGDLHVAGHTVPELRDMVVQAYGNILHDPVISISLKDFEKPYFIASGQVSRPGKYDLRGQTTLTEAVAMAGGFLDSAAHSQVLLFRRAPNGWFAAQLINVKKMQKQGNLAEDPPLRPGDMLFVPKNRISKIKPFIPGASVGAMVNPY